MERFQLLATVNILLIKDGSILLICRKNTNFFDGYYESPAGHVDGNEPIRVAAAREAREEVGVSIRPEDLTVVHVMHRYGEKHERIEFYLVAKAWEGEPENKEPEKCSGIGWFPLNALPDNTVPKSKFAFEQYQAGNIFSEYDWKT